ncbi:hypothetical protein LguiA_011621 [Lonicera macranthoides]
MPGQELQSPENELREIWVLAGVGTSGLGNPNGAFAKIHKSVKIAQRTDLLFCYTAIMFIGRAMYNLINICFKTCRDESKHTFALIIPMGKVDGGGLKKLSHCGTHDRRKQGGGRDGVWRQELARRERRGNCGDVATMTVIEAGGGYINSGFKR